MNTSAIATAVIDLLENLPNLIPLGEEAVAFIVNAVASFRALLSNPATTQAQIDQTITDIQTLSAQIQAQA